MSRLLQGTLRMNVRVKLVALRWLRALGWALTSVLTSAHGLAPAIAAEPGPDSVQVLVASLSGHPFRAFRSPQKALMAPVQALRARCEASEPGPGSLQAAATALVFRDRVGNTGLVESTSVTDFLVCRVQGQVAWGVVMAVEAPELFSSGNGTPATYRGTVQLTYLDAGAAQAEVEQRTQQAQQRQAQRLACLAQEAHARQALRTQPQTGQDTALGRVVDVRPPLVLVQFNPLERARRQQDQAWLRAEELDVVQGCF